MSFLACVCLLFESNAWQSATPVHVPTGLPLQSRDTRWTVFKWCQRAYNTSTKWIFAAKKWLLNPRFDLGNHRKPIYSRINTYKDHWCNQCTSQASVGCHSERHCDCPRWPTPLCPEWPAGQYETLMCWMIWHWMRCQVLNGVFLKFLKLFAPQREKHNTVEALAVFPCHSRGSPQTQVFLLVALAAPGTANELEGQTCGKGSLSDSAVCTRPRRMCCIGVLRDLEGWLAESSKSSASPSPSPSFVSSSRIINHQPLFINHQ